MRRIAFLIIIVGMFISLVPVELEGVPVFARKHKLSCKTCHDPFPRLKPFGEEFAGNGFTIGLNKRWSVCFSPPIKSLHLPYDFPTLLSC